MMHTMDDYMNALDGAGPKMKELIIERAANDEGLDLWDLRKLVALAYPEE